MAKVNLRLQWGLIRGERLACERDMRFLFIVAANGATSSHQFLRLVLGAQRSTHSSLRPVEPFDESIVIGSLGAGRTGAPSVFDALGHERSCTELPTYPFQRLSSPDLCRIVEGYCPP